MLPSPLRTRRQRARVRSICVPVDHVAVDIEHRHRSCGRGSRLASWPALFSSRAFVLVGMPQVRRQWLHRLSTLHPLARRPLIVGEKAPHSMLELQRVAADQVPQLPRRRRYLSSSCLKSAHSRPHQRRLQLNTPRPARQLLAPARVTLASFYI